MNSGISQDITAHVPPTPLTDTFLGSDGDTGKKNKYTSHALVKQLEWFYYTRNKLEFCTHPLAMYNQNLIVTQKPIHCLCHPLRFQMLLTNSTYNLSWFSIHRYLPIVGLIGGALPRQFQCINALALVCCYYATVMTQFTCLGVTIKGKLLRAIDCLHPSSSLVSHGLLLCPVAMHNLFVFLLTISTPLVSNNTM